MRLADVLSAIKPYVLGWIDGKASPKLTGRWVAMQIVPSGGFGNAAGTCCYSITAGGGASLARWVATGSGVTNRWLQAGCTLPADYASDTGLTIKMRLKATGGTPSIENWQFYATVAGAGDGDSWRTANADTVGATINGVSAVVSNSAWVDYTLKSFSVPAGTGPGEHVIIDVGPGVTSVTWANDILVGAVWVEYTAVG